MEKQSPRSAKQLLEAALKKQAGLSALLGRSAPKPSPPQVDSAPSPLTGLAARAASKPPDSPGGHIYAPQNFNPYMESPGFMTPMAYSKPLHMALDTWEKSLPADHSDTGISDTLAQAIQQYHKENNHAPDYSTGAPDDLDALELLMEMEALSQGGVPDKSAGGVVKVSAASQGQLDLLERLKQLGIIGAGAGATYGIAQGLHRMTRKPLALGSGSNVPTSLPIANVKPEEEELQQRPRLKLAGIGRILATQALRGLGRAAGRATGVGKTIGEAVTNSLPDANTIAGMLPEPNNANVMTGNSIPLSAAAAAIPAVAAYKGVRGLFDTHRKSQQEAELEAAKKQYEQSLADQYRSVVSGKTAEAKEVTDGIDALFEKQAVIRDAFSKLMGLLPVANPENLYGSAAVGASRGALGNNPAEGFNSLRGMTNLAALLAAGSAGKYMYDKSLKTSPDKIMQEALGRRSRQRRAVPNVLTPQLLAESE